MFTFLNLLGSNSEAQQQATQAEIDYLNRDAAAENEYLNRAAQAEIDYLNRDSDADHAAGNSALDWFGL